MLPGLGRMAEQQPAHARRQARRRGQRHQAPERCPPDDGALGPRAIQDVDDFTAGVNQYIDEALMDPSKLPGEYEALQQQPEPWKPTDTVAIASLSATSR